MRNPRTIRKEIDEAYKRLRLHVNDKVKNSPEVIAAQKKVSEVTKSFHEIREKVEKEAQDMFSYMSREIETLVSELEKSEQEDARKTQEALNAIPDSIKNFLKRLVSGWERKQDYTVFWWSDDERFVVIKSKGGMFWSGRGEQSYGKTAYTLYDINKAYAKGNDMFDSYKSRVAGWEGRWSKVKQKEVDEKIKEYLEGD